MPTAVVLERVADSLLAYRNQLATISQALGALREASDQILANLAQDQAAISATLAAAAAPGHADTAIAIEDLTSRLPAATSDDVATQAVADTVIDAAAATIAAVDHEAGHKTLTAEAVAEPASTVDAGNIEQALAAEARLETSEQMNIAADIEADYKGEQEATAGIEPSASNDAEHPASIEITSNDITLTPPVSEAVASPARVADEMVVADTEVAAGDGKVVSLDSRRAVSPASPTRRRAFAVVATLAIAATGTLGFHELLQTEIGMRLIEFGTCDGDMLSANRDCALLAWLML